MIVYIDTDYKSHALNDGTMREVDVSWFDGKTAEFINGFRYVPSGETWTRSDGVEFHGEMIAPAKDYNRILTDVAISYLDDDQAESVTELYPMWEVGATYAVGDRRQYNGLLYRCVQAHTSQSDWTPDVTPALWVRTSTEEWPEWVQPTGAHDAYPLNAKVSHNGKHWINTGKDGNEYEPGVWGWDEVVE